MNQNMALFYGFESLLGVIGIFPLLKNLFYLENPNPLENKIKWIFFTLMLLFIIRFPYQAFHNHFSERLTYAVATLLVLNVFLYFETLLRRHMPFLLKIFATIFTIIFFIDTLFLNFIEEKSHFMAFGFSIFVLQSSVIIIAFLRKKEDNTKSENSLINISVLSLLLFVPFFLSDVRSFHELLNLPHLGVLGTLLFTYAAFHDQAIVANNLSFLKKIAKIIIFSAFLVVILLSLAPTYDNDFITHSFVLFMIIHLIIRIHYIAKELEGADNFFKFIERMVESDKTNLLSFLKDIQLFFKNVEVKLLSGEELKNYQLEKINAFFDQKQTHLFNAIDLRDSIQQKENADSNTHEDLEIMEQMIDILEKYEMSHICRMSGKQSLFLLFNFQMIGRSNIVYTQTALISEISKMFERQ